MTISNFNDVGLNRSSKSVKHQFHLKLSATFNAIKISCFKPLVGWLAPIFISLFLSNSLTATEVEKKPIGIAAISSQPFVFLKGYQAKYKVISKKKTLGSASRTLALNNGEWTLTSLAKISKLFFTLRNNETSQFHIDSKKLYSDRFYSRTKLTFKKARVMEQKFDWLKMVETGRRNKQKWQLKLQQKVFDRASHIFQLRADLITGEKQYSYPVSYKGRVTEYVYHIEKKETIKTKIGTLSALKLVRYKSKGDRFIFWLCPEMNYFPIKIAQYEKGKPDVTLILDSFEYLPDNSTQKPRMPIKTKSLKPE